MGVFISYIKKSIEFMQIFIIFYLAKLPRKTIEKFKGKGSTKKKVKLNYSSAPFFCVLKLLTNTSFRHSNLLRKVFLFSFYFFFLLSPFFPFFLGAPR